MDRTKKIDFNSLTTFELAFNLATGVYDEREKFEALKVIQSRDKLLKDGYLSSESKEQESTKDQNLQEEKRNVKPPLKGSKSEKIYKLAKESRSVQEVYELLNKRGIVTYYPEIYRIFKRYGKA